MSNGSPLSEVEEIELDRSLAEIQRYPLEIDAEGWQQLRDLARAGDRRGQLALLRSTIGRRPGPIDVVPRFAPSDVAPRSADHPVPAIIQELLDRLQAAEQRAVVAEERLRQLEEGA